MVKSELLKFYDAYVFDMDGTIYLGDSLLPGVSKVIAQLREKHIPVRFLSNNPTKNPQQYAEKLLALGIPTNIEDIANTIVTTARWLKDHHPTATLFCISEEPLKNHLTSEGFNLSENPKEIDIVIASYDRTFDYRKLQIAFDAIWFYKRAFLIQTNPDRFCPFPGGHGEPDCAAITAAIEACTNTKCEVNLGKPSPIMLAEALKGLNVEPKRCLMVGDRLHTDIKMGVDIGMDTALVLTGESTVEEAQELPKSQQPTYLLERIDQLIPKEI